MAWEMGTKEAIAKSIERLLHPLRAIGLSQFLARPPEALGGPCRISHLALMHKASETARQEAGGGRWPSLDSLCQYFPRRQDTLRTGPGLYRANLEDGLWCRWELYDTFHTYTFFSELDDDSDDGAFARTPLERLPLAWLESLPEDTLISGTHLTVNSRPTKIGVDSIRDRVKGPFGSRRVYGSELHTGAAWAFTDFCAHGDGFSRVMIFDRRLADPREEHRLLGSLQAHSGPGRLVQQLLAMEVFRSLSLFGEPWVGHMGRKLGDLNTRHVKLMREVEKKHRHGRDKTRSTKDLRTLLSELCLLHFLLEELGAKYNPRLESSHVWYQHTRDLLGELKETPLEGFQRIGEFTRSRVAEVERDRAAVERGYEDMSLRLQRSGDLLRTQVTVDQMEAQNATAIKVQRLTVVAVLLSLVLGRCELEDFLKRIASASPADVSDYLTSS